MCVFFFSLTICLLQYAKFIYKIIAGALNENIKIVAEKVEIMRPCVRVCVCEGERRGGGCKSVLQTLPEAQCCSPCPQGELICFPNSHSVYVRAHTHVQQCISISIIVKL